MRTSIQVGTLIGIPIRLHFTFLFILVGIIGGFATLPATEYRVPLGLGGIPMSPFVRYSLATAAAVLFFFTLLLHEMSHSYVAMKFGTKIHSITLFFFGGLAMMEDLPKSPREEWRIAIAGPLMSFALGGLFLLTSWLLKLATLIFGVPASVLRPVTILVFSLGFLNVGLGVFNLVPAFPLDGGRVFRAFLATRMPFLKATKRAVLVGKIFAVVMAVGGFLADPITFFLRGEVVSGNFWFPLLAVFLFIAATEEENATATFAALEGVKVRDVMRTERTSVPEGATVAEVAKKMLEERTVEFAVVSEGGELRGFVTWEDIKKVRPEQHLTALDVVARAERGGGAAFESVEEFVFPEEAAAVALKKMMKSRRKVLAVRDAVSGEFVGIITRRDLSDYIEMLR